MLKCFKKKAQGASAPVAKSYAEVFMQRAGITVRTRAAVYVDKETKLKLKRIWAAAGGGVTFTSYTENIVREHLETHREQIEQLFKG